MAVNSKARHVKNKNYKGKTYQEIKKEKKKQQEEKK